MELMQCFEQGCKNEVECSCPCTSPETLCCEMHVLKHMKLPNRTHAFNSIFVEPCQETKDEILKFLTRENSKNSKLKGKVLASFSQRLLESENDIEELLKNLDSGSAEISNYFTKISQAQKLSKSEQDPILGLLSLQPNEAIEKLKKIIPANQEWSKSAKLFCLLSEKIEKMIERFIRDKFEAYLDKRLSNIENSLQEHIKSANEENKKIIGSTNDQIANMNDSISELINENKKSERDFKDWKEEIMLKTKNEIDLLNSQIIKINQDLIKINETEKAQKILQELREKRSDILNRPNDPELEQDFRRAWLKFSSDIYADDPTLQQAYQDYSNAYRQKTSLYTILNKDSRTNLIIYDTENDTKEVRIVETPEPLNADTCIAQLPNGNLFCFGKLPSSGVSLIIDKNNIVQELPSGTPCCQSSAIYFNNSLYCFGGYNGNVLTLSERYDLNENRWIKLKPLPKADGGCASVIFNGNIVISGHNNKNLLKYSIGSNTFTSIPYDCKAKTRKILISAERLYLIECKSGSIYESELLNDTALRRIGDSIINIPGYQVYLSYNKEGINIALACSKAKISYFKFNLEEKILTKLDEIIF